MKMYEHEGRMVIPTIDYRAGAVTIIDQSLLPREEKILQLSTVVELGEAIRSLKVRGAPAIGIAAAYGVLLALENFLREKIKSPPAFFFDRLKDMKSIACSGVDVKEMREQLAGAREVLAGTRPTAFNLFWALERMRTVVDGGGSDPGELCRQIAREAFRIHEEELEIEIAIGANGASVIENGMNVLTHCNAGGLATAGYGTALAVLYRAHEDGKRFHVFADETRPLLQGARLTAWELEQRGISVTVLCDAAAPSLFAAGRIDVVIVGADRIAGNGDIANKIGTLGLAVLCERYRKPFYVAAPWSTFDPTITSGTEIPIEKRMAEEVTCFSGVQIAPQGSTVYNPAFDVTPAQLITAFITERGVIDHPDTEKIRTISQSGSGGGR